MTNANDPRDAGSVVVVTFALSDPRYPFVGISEREQCRVALERMVPRGSGEYAEFVSVRGADPHSILNILDGQDVVEPNLLSSYENGGLFEFVVEGFCPARDLAERGAVPVEVTSEDGSGHIVVEIPGNLNDSTVINEFLDDHPAAELESKRTSDRLTPLFERSDLHRAVNERLTDRQLEVLQTAYEASYYGATSETTGEELGDALGISASTVSQHLQAAERKLVAILFEERIADDE